MHVSGGRRCGYLQCSDMIVCDSALLVVRHACDLKVVFFRDSARLVGHPVCDYESEIVCDSVRLVVHHSCDLKVVFVRASARLACLRL